MDKNISVDGGLFLCDPFFDAEQRRGQYSLFHSKLPMV
jgi:hypothetical protein